ncbi:glycosyltransferase [Agromyces sp. CFH 90414]|uniref:D-inositol 3-phosphate glycosyltransferase n=1 Tax=Agromyces agglutinans TaxID=2662258 RepID=A0A6I2F7A7_9MICO|nr:glycosyltransferase [Agromyces agglutinans]MRG61365.1 glycosyltransferase [Agromyces agglutinans]
MKVALLAESFLPHMNGVTNSLLRVIEHLDSRGDEALVIAPRAGRLAEASEAVDHPALRGATARYLRSVPLPGYADVRLAFASTHRLTVLLREFDADVVHLASPFVLGWQGVQAARAAGVPSVAVYQTDVPAYAQRYGVPIAAPALERHLVRLHNRATLTLAPSAAARRRLDELGVERVRPWARGVDTDLFHPRRRDAAWRRRIAPAGEVVVGYVGRLAPEKQVGDLAALAGLPGVRLVIVGDGPERATLERRLPGAVFTGFLSGTALAEAVAGFDVFVHPGEHETFCQTVQEALASGVPVVAVGRGGPLDLVQSSRTGWLYRPGDLGDLRARVQDLTGDEAKRRAFGLAARASVEGRSWRRLGDELIGHYEDAIAGRVGVEAPASSRGRAASRSESGIEASDRPAAPRPAAPCPASPPPASPRPVAAPPTPLARRGQPWRRLVAVGDSITEGLCDDSRSPGVHRGWADRLALLVALADPAGPSSLGYANLAVRSRRVHDVADEQLPRARALGADLVTVLVGGNDLVKAVADPVGLAARLGEAIAETRATGADVLVVSAFMPPSRGLGRLRARFERFDAELERAVAACGALWVDAASDAELIGPPHWAEDRVHLNSAGHRALAYAAARVLGIPDASALGALDVALHAPDEASDAPTRVPTAVWLARHAAPWAVRRLRGRTAGDGLAAKHDALVPVVAGDGPRPFV